MKTEPRRRNLSERAFDQIKRDIVWCDLAPGEEISEARLSAIYNLGKAPIRHALSKLTQEGYVIAVPRSGHVIAPVTLQLVKEIFDFRLLLEPEIMERACGNVDPQRLRKLNLECTRGYTPGDRASESAFMTANYNFHMEIARCCGNSRMSASLSQTMEEMTRLLHLGFVMRERPKEMRSEHKSLIDALVKNDKALARQITVTHIQTVRALVIEGIMNHTNLNGTNIALVRRG